MVIVNHVTYYTIDEIMLREDNKLTKDEITAFLEKNPSYGKIINGEWYSFHLAVRFMNRENEVKNVYLAGAQGLDMRDVQFRGRILDIGAGGEGIIGQISGEQAVGIAPEEHKRGLENAPGSGLKIMMDAREMKFLNNTFDSAAAFYTLMYIENKFHKKVFSEIYRVLKPGGECYIWDMVIPEKKCEDRENYLMGIEVKLKDKVILSGYGTPWTGKQQSAEYFEQLAVEAGFSVSERFEEDKLIYLKLIK